ncbi:hypothetical protein AcW1_002308 [Taiwanofungus camphoratus]|nr:hypothetical protein AcV5_010310 [Antrodia cinnamomea]KAI0944646.1 hypothetical protein AcW1_002308 [Antrodia cinnamomea]
MESLLRWGIEHSTNDDGEQPASQRPRQNLDTGVIDAILGKSDAQLMKEALAVAVDETKNEEDRIQALDDFEMLVEQIDNANNIEKLKMWEPLHGLLTSPTSPDEITMQTLWIVGTAVQNNPSAQASYLSLGPVPSLLSFLSPSVKSAKIRSKAMYALSGLLKHNATAVQQLQDANGWEVLKTALEDSDITVRRKVAFLLNTLIIPTFTVPQPQQFVSGTPQSLASHQPDSATSVTLHPSAEQPSQNDIVHPNSHASMQLDPSSYSTSPTTLKAFQEHGLLQTLISSLTNPVPYGADGESEGDLDFEEKVTRSLHTYVTSCHGQFSDEQKRKLRAYLSEHTEKAGGEGKLAEKWSLTEDEIQVLKRAVS